MARCARKKSASGIYHIMLRGINRQDKIKGIEGVTQRQIARVTGIHQSIIFKV